MDIDGDHLGTAGQQTRYSDESSLGQAGIAALVECSCRNVLAHRHADWDRRGLTGFYSRVGQHRKVTEGVAVAVVVGTCEEVVAE